MRALPQSLAQSLATGATTHARAWEVRRTDGVVMGFTEHDRNLSFDGVTFRADSGLGASAVEIASGLSIDTHQVLGALASEGITEADLERGVYDGAEVIQWLVDWTDPSSRMMLSRGFIGETRRQGAHFEAEVRGLADKLNQPIGRAFLRDCDARLGDGRCKVDLSAPEWRGSGQVVAVLAAQRYLVDGLGGHPADFFAHGTATFTGGANQGHVGMVRIHDAGAPATVELWLAPPLTVALGDTLELVAGCDKAADTCRAKFSNFMNFQGFPHMPGDDWATGYADEGGAHDGGSLFRR